MKKEKIENTNDAVEERAEDTDAGTASSIPKKRAVLSRKKSGSCGFGVIGKAIFSFLVFVVVLGGIGFGVVWILENEKMWNFWQEDRPAVSEVIKSVDEKIEVKPETEDQEKENVTASESGAKQDTSIKPAQLPVLVLNAGGPAGSAGKVTGMLSQAGYTSAKAGNATIFTYKNVTVYYADDASKADAEKVSEALKKNYPTVTVQKAGSADEKKEKIVVMVGS